MPFRSVSPLSRHVKTMNSMKHSFCAWTPSEDADTFEGASRHIRGVDPVKRAKLTVKVRSAKEAPVSYDFRASSCITL